MDRSEDRRHAIVLVGAMAALMWLLEIADQVTGEGLDQHGIEPREADGLIGVLTAPFLHAGLDHLAANTVPFVAMGVVIALKGLGRVLAVTLIVMVVSGLGTWVTGPEASLHIGASGVVFGYGTYLLTRGVFNRDLGELAIAAVVAVLWGGALLGGIVPRDGISWQGHLFGAIGGVIAARALAPAREPERS